jgi:hypothetical protein
MSFDLSRLTDIKTKTKDSSMVGRKVNIQGRLSTRLPCVN